MKKHRTDFDLDEKELFERKLSEVLDTYNIGSDKYSKKEINPKYYKRITISGNPSNPVKELTREEFMKGDAGIVWINTKTDTISFKEDAIVYPSFWFMRDNQTFCKPNGKNFEEIKNDLIKIASENPYGMICPVIIMMNDIEVRRVGEMVYVDKDGKVDIDGWYNLIKNDDAIIDFIKKS